MTQDQRPAETNEPNALSERHKPSWQISPSKLTDGELRGVIAGKRDDQSTYRRAQVVTQIGFQPNRTPEEHAAFLGEFVKALPYPSWAVQKAFDEWVRTSARAPSPNEIRILVNLELGRFAKELSKRAELREIKQRREPRVTPETANRILAEAGYSTAPTAEAIAVRKAARDKDFCPTCGSRDDYSDGHCFECEERAA